MGPELTKAVEKKLGCTVSQVWGMSETTGSVTIQPWDEKDDTGCISEIQPNTKLRILDNEENDVEDGHPGELVVQGQTVSPGYWDNPKATEEAFTKCGEWFKTGDIGLRRNNKFYIVDRKKVSHHILIVTYFALTDNLMSRSSSNIRDSKLPLRSWKHFCYPTLSLWMRL
jgi:long-subunit acyl-CoA synthetase (AMP-forming)